jgi:GntR family transcriptional regulator
MSMSQTRHSALAGRLTHHIRTGHYPPGSLLPSEAELALSNGVARGTVRMALAALEKEGLVERRRGSGTRVLGDPTPPGFGQTVSGIDELIQYARDTKRVVQSQDDLVADRALARLLGVDPGSRWVRIRSTRIDPTRPSLPVCATDTYIRAELAAATSLLNEDTVALCELIARTSGVRTADIEQDLQATLVPDALADSLKAPAGSPALRIIRRYRDSAGWIFESSVSLHPADRFTYRMRLRRTI